VKNFKNQLKKTGENMRYRTTIEVISEAKSKDEAMEIVDGYLSGNLISGIDMRCTTRPVCNYKAGVISVSVVSALVVVVVLSLMHFDPSSKAISYSPASSTCQPALKTQAKDISSSEFRKEWDNKQTKEALERIKRTD
jgi:hypothetical protein